MVHGLAAQSGGALTITSRPGVGTNVEIWLPASVASAEQLPTSDHGPPTFSTLGTALLVDDEVLICRDCKPFRRTDLTAKLRELGNG